METIKLLIMIKIIFLGALDQWRIKFALWCAPADTPPTLKHPEQ